MSLRELLERTSWWEPALGSLRAAWEAHGDEARRNARDVAALYQGRRAAMVVDVVMSRQRKYERRVRPLIEAFEQTPASASLDALTREDLQGVLPLVDGEEATIRGVAASLLRFAQDHGLQDDDEAAVAWAEATTPAELAHALDPYVGAVKGIGPALFAYIRMRSGADTIKIDGRVRKVLRRHGVPVAELSDAQVLVLAWVIAESLECRKVELDQLLWFSAD